MKFSRVMRWACVLLMAGMASVHAQEVKIMSYNIRFGTAEDGANAWKNRSAMMIDQIRRQDPDTLGLQEALRFQIDEIRKALPQYGEVGIGRDGGDKDEYSCILYNTNKFEVVDSGTFWLSRTPEKHSLDWNAALVRICTWALLTEKETGMRFYHFNTHLDYRSAEARLNGVRLIAERIAARKPDIPVVLTGDFNAAEDSPPVKYVKGTLEVDDGSKTPVILVDAFRVLHPDEKVVGTSNRFVGDKSGAKIDYILVQPETRVLSADIDFSMPDGRCISDHFPVTATVAFHNDGEPAPDDSGQE